jgi:hypothetical protein
MQLVWDLNFARRQLNAGQRAAAVKQYHSFLVLGDPEIQREKAVVQDGPPISIDEAAKKANTGKSTIKRIKFVAAHAENPDEVIEEIKQGTRSLDKTVKELKSDQSEDRLGLSIPPAALPYWERRGEIADMIHHASALRVGLKKIKDGDPLYRRLSKRGEKIREVDSIHNQLVGILPSYVCGDCNGQTIKDGKTCGACDGTGLLSAYFDRQCLPPEKRANART